MAYGRLVKGSAAAEPDAPAAAAAAAASDKLGSASYAVPAPGAP
eukprot:CAMPEP_0198308986 /NCGR_PEP_ID=MMETSP1450-20131203/1473_1 /TAXON_ID=753684 ORGANISM="Madagascaria erythrocladiodes, Strain CCMP3234" /NCGR_SAMPLE_ID=MMETSP1450 /ASSEMBLY_ACC=CAM_ASM_001115 /LENGTH=43 /DNA_ID= /DNA_START= /DNA_END= /DNA_ORIENTATION=